MYVFFIFFGGGVLMRRQQWIFCTGGALAAVVLLSSVPAASAAFVLVDDFDSYTDGAALGSQGGWMSADADNTVGVDPTDGSNNVLSTDTTNTGGDSNIFNTVSLPLGSTGTLFGRFYIAGGTSNVSFGLSDETSPSGFGSFEAQNVVTGGKLRGRDGGGFADLTNGSNEADDIGVWYNFWMVMDNADPGQTLQTYIQSDGDSDFATQLAVSDPSPPQDFRDQVPDTGDLVTLFLRVDVSQNQNGVLFDDFYFDDAGENLVNPIPEPSTLVLGLVLGLAGIVRGKRR